MSVTALELVNPGFVHLGAFNLDLIKKEKLIAEQSVKMDEGTVETSNVKNEIIIHHSGGADADKCLRDNEGVAKCHYWILSNGDEVDCLHNDMAIPSCTGAANTNSIGIEISSDGTHFTPAQINATARLIRRLRSDQRFAIPATTDIRSMNYKGHTGNPGGVFSHANVCAMLRTEYAGKEKNDPPEKIFEEIVKKAGIPYTGPQPRCP